MFVGHLYFLTFHLLPIFYCLLGVFLVVLHELVIIYCFLCLSLAFWYIFLEFSRNIYVFITHEKENVAFFKQMKMKASVLYCVQPPTTSQIWRTEIPAGRAVKFQEANIMLHKYYTPLNLEDMNMTLKAGVRLF